MSGAGVGEEGEVMDNLKTWPERIWLQHGEEDAIPDFHEAYSGYGEITWCQDSVDPHNVEYVRADLFEQLQQRIAELEAERDGFKKKVAASIGNLHIRMNKSYMAEPTRRITFMDMETVHSIVEELGLGGCLDAAASTLTKEEKNERN